MLDLCLCVYVNKDQHQSVWLELIYLFTDSLMITPRPLVRLVSACKIVTKKDLGDKRYTEYILNILDGSICD